MAVTVPLCYKRKDSEIFLVYELEGDTLTARIGTPGQPCVVVNHRQNREAMEAWLVAQSRILLRWDYTECANPPQMIDGSVAEIIWSNELPADPKFNNISADIARFFVTDRDQPIAHFKDGFSYSGDFDFGLLIYAAAVAVLVEGPVVIDGVLQFKGRVLLVEIYGDVSAFSVVSGDTLTKVYGNVAVAQTILGDGNDGHLWGFGAGSGEALVAPNHDISFKEPDFLHKYVINEWDSSWVDQSLFVPNDGDEDYLVFDGELALARVLERKSFVAEGGKP